MNRNQNNNNNKINSSNSSNNNNKIQGTTKIRKATRALNPIVRKGSEFKYSNFFITIQTNYRAKNNHDFEQFQDKFAVVLERLFDREHMDDHLIKFISPHEEDKWKYPTIQQVDVDTNIEEGKTRRGGISLYNIIISIY